MIDATDRNPDRRVRAARRVAAPASQPVVKAAELWQQHCAWCPRCEATRPGCELGRKSYDLYAWLARIPTRRAG